MSNELRKQVLSIIETLENPPVWCQDCESEHIELESDEIAVCPECGDEMQPVSGFDYLNETLDIEYTVNSRREYLGASVLVTFGGPSIRIDTRRRMVIGNWWDDSYSASFTDEIGLDEVCAELFDC